MLLLAIIAADRSRVFHQNFSALIYRRMKLNFMQRELLLAHFFSLNFRI
jgi:hypothetical protein